MMRRMNEIYEYRSIRVARGSWSRVKEALEGPGAARTTEAGGSYYGAWRGQIGLGANEGVVMTAWPDVESLARGCGACVEGIADIIESSFERFEATVRPRDTTRPELAGIYAHRRFEIDDAEWPEFLALSEGAWPSFEKTNDANIIGFFKSLDVDPPQARVLLLTRYASLAVWELSRGHRTDTLTEPEAYDRFVRRAKLTRSTVVVTTEPL